ncbi:unnamed protein product [Arabidopsis lyrata]|nr:unnamed protein product [Arabidopsis lyrata]
MFSASCHSFESMHRYTVSSTTFHKLKWFYKKILQDS